MYRENVFSFFFLPGVIVACVSNTWAKPSEKSSGWGQDFLCSGFGGLGTTFPIRSINHLSGSGFLSPVEIAFPVRQQSNRPPWYRPGKSWAGENNDAVSGPAGAGSMSGL